MPSEDTVIIEMESAEERATLPLDAFSKVVAAVRSMLETLDETDSAKWRIESLSLTNPLHMEIGGVAKRERVDRRVVDNFMGVMRAIDTGSAPPPRAAKGVVRKGRTIIQTLNTGLGRLRIASPGRGEVVPVRKPLEDTRAIQKAVEPPEHEDYVQLDGVLKIIGSVTEDRAFYVVDRVTGHQTECSVSDADFIKALEAMKASPDHAPRISVAGKTWYRNGRPSRMRVDRFEVFPEVDDAAIFYAVQGIDLTGGMDTAAYVRSLRND